MEECFIPVQLRSGTMEGRRVVMRGVGRSTAGGFFFFFMSGMD